jgi:histone H3/H4
MARTKKTEMVKLVNQKARSGKEGRGGPGFQERMRLAGMAAAAGKVVMSGNAAGGEMVVKKKPRYRPGVRALMDIRKYQKCNKPILRMIPFTRLVRDRGLVVAKEKFSPVSSVWDGLRYKRVALEVLREMMELWMVRLLEDALLCCLHRKVKGVQTKDLLLARRMREKPTYQWQYEQVEYTRGKGNKKK